MYLESFGLKKPPFSLTSDPTMLYFTDAHREVLAALCYGLLERKGLLLLLGHAGTGKSTLMARAVLGLPPNRVQFASILNPTFTSGEFIETVLMGFGIRDIPSSKPQRLARLEKHLLQTQTDGKIAALIVDEAHKLGTEALEEVRLLGNLERRSEKLLQIILAGQTELADTMNRGDCVQLKQRVALRLSLRPLAPAEVGQYIACRWARAGGQHAPFAPQAVDLIGRVSDGIPRVINVICDNSLIFAFGEKKRTVEATHVSRSCEELDLLDGSAGAIEDSEFVPSQEGEAGQWQVTDGQKSRIKVSRAGR